MKYFMLIATVFSFVLAGCAPQLANRELGSDEKEWKEYLEPMYPGWEAPGTLPPAIADNNTKKVADSNKDDVLPPFDGAETDSSKKTVADTNADKSLTANAADNEKIQVRYDEYTVTNDDSLSIIAKKVYGNGRKFHRIYKANEDIIKNQNKIYPGMKLRIPRP